MKVLVLYTLPPVSVAPGRIAYEFDMSDAAHSIAEVLPEAIVAGVHGEVREVLARLDQHQPDVVFNVCEAPLGRPDLEASVAALLEWLGVQFTGCRSETLALCRRKDRVNALLASVGVPVPRTKGFPCIVKPADEDGSAGIDENSICANASEVARAQALLKGLVVIQEFLPGREFAVSLWGREEPCYASIGETCFRGGARLNTYAAKWDVDSADFTNTPLVYTPQLDPPLRKAVIAVACETWRAVSARGYLSVDIRLDAAGVPRVLDVNPNPELWPDGIYRAVIEAGWSWERFVRQQLEWAC